MKDFSHIDHVVLARAIFIRWGSDLGAATVAWRRLFQNSTTREQFAQLINYPDCTIYCQGECVDHSAKK